MSDLELENDELANESELGESSDQLESNEGEETAPLSMEDTIRAKFDEIKARERGDEPEVRQNNGVKPPVAEKPPVATEPPADYPSTWKKEVQAEWAALTPAVKQEILRREADMRNGIDQYKDKAVYAETIYGMLNKFDPILKKEGIGHKQLVENMLNTSYTLYAGSPEQKIMTLITLAQRNGVNLEGLVNSVGAMASGKPAVDPTLLAVQQQLAEVTNQQQEFQNQQVQAVYAQQAQTVQQFAADPAHKYYNEAGVRELMATLVESGQATSLLDAYNKAIGALPEVRAKLFAEQQEESNRLAAEKAAKAKKASGTNIKTVGKHSGKTVQPKGTMEDTIRNKLRELQAAGND